MKKICVILACIVLFTASIYTCHSQNYRNIRKEDKLLGPVQSCKLMETSFTKLKIYKPNGQLDYIKTSYISGIEAEEYYDEKGRRIYSDSHLTGGGHFTYSYNGNTCVCKYYDEDNELCSTDVTKQIEEYDTEGRLVKHGENDSFSTYEYDSEGRELKRTDYRDGKMDGIYATKYDSKGREIEYTVYNEEHSLTDRCIYEYSGKYCYESQYEGNDLEGKFTYVKDNAGNIIECEGVNFETGNKFAYTVNYMYDSYGNWIYKKYDYEYGGTDYEIKREITYY